MATPDQLERIKRRRELVNSMFMQNVQSPIQGDYGIAQALAKIGTSFLAARGEKGLDLEEEQAKGQYRQGLNQEVLRYLDTYQGKPGETMSTEQVRQLMLQDQPPPSLAEPMKADPRRAVIEAMTSQYPEMQGIGAATLPTLGKAQRNIKEVNGKLIEVPDVGAPEVLGDYGNAPEQWEDLVLPDPETGKATIFRRNKATNKIEQVTHPGTRVTTNVGGTKVTLPGQDKGWDAWATKAVDNLEKRAVSAQGSVDLAGQLQQMLELGKGDLVSGPLADPIIFMQSLTQSLGMGNIDAAKLADAENYRSVGQRALQAYVNTLQGGARGITKEEMDELKNAVPRLQQSPQARMRLAEILLHTTERNIQSYRRAASSLNEALKTKDMGKYDFIDVMLPETKPVSPLPAQQRVGTEKGRGTAPSGGSTQQPISLDEYLRKKKGK